MDLPLGFKQMMWFGKTTTELTLGPKSWSFKSSKTNASEQKQYKDITHKRYIKSNSTHLIAVMMTVLCSVFTC